MSENDLSFVDFIIKILSVPFGSEILAAVIGGIVTFCVTHFTINKQLKADFQNRLGEKKSEALIKARELIEMTTTYELYSVHPSDNVPEKMDLTCNTFAYPTVMIDKQHLYDFAVMVSDTRRNYEKHLDLKSASYLYILEKYVMNLARFLSTSQCDDDGYKWIGAYIFIDFEKWAKDYDEILVKQLNHPSFTFFAKTGKRWKREKKAVESKYFHGTELEKLYQEAAGHPFTDNSDNNN